MFLVLTTVNPLLPTFYAPNLGEPNYIKQLLTDVKGETDRNAIIIGDLNTPLTVMHRSFKQKVSNICLK